MNDAESMREAGRIAEDTKPFLPMAHSAELLQEVGESFKRQYLKQPTETMFAITSAIFTVTEFIGRCDKNSLATFDRWMEEAHQRRQDFADSVTKKITAALSGNDANLFKLLEEETGETLRVGSPSARTPAPKGDTREEEIS